MAPDALGTPHTWRRRPRRVRRIFLRSCAVRRPRHRPRHASSCWRPRETAAPVRATPRVDGALARDPLRVSTRRHRQPAPAGSGRACAAAILSGARGPEGDITDRGSPAAAGTPRQGYEWPEPTPASPSTIREGVRPELLGYEWTFITRYKGCNIVSGVVREKRGSRGAGENELSKRKELFGERIDASASRDRLKRLCGCCA
jgi:hypothetical protein